MEETCIHPVPEDGIIFHKDTIEIEETMIHEDYTGARITLIATLGNARIPIQIDIGFTDLITPKARNLSFPALLNDMEMATLLGYPLESIISEKFHAMVRKADINSRLKDFYDIWMLCEQNEFQGSVLQKAISTTFRHRETLITPSLPQALSNEFVEKQQRQWQAFLTKNKLLTGNLVSFLTVVEKLRAFLMPPVEAITLEQPFTRFWKAGKGWE